MRSLFRCAPTPSFSGAYRCRSYRDRVRHFHSSRPNQIINETVVLAHNALESVHSVTGLPWAVSIPLTAVLVRLTIAMPFQIWSLSHSSKMKKLNPLVVGWGRYFQGAVLTKAAVNRAYISPNAAEIQSQLLLRKKTKELYKRWKIRPWTRFAPLFQLPVWLTMMESMRRMVGMTGGLLSIVQGWLEKHPEAPNVPMVPSLYTEGALWFPDLLAADPYCALPVILSAAVFTNVTWGWKIKKREDIPKLPTRKERIAAHTMRVLKRAFQASALFLCPVMIASEVPAGMLIYWISSTLFATAQTKALPKIISTKSIPAPCKEKAVAVVIGGEVKTQLSGFENLGEKPTKIKTFTGR
ncbi:membrane insertase COX18 [Coccidioides immitis RS]|uniref:Membrane insertase YidC/Oxa/ALB C-terminal domain-containing protein n=1 Tax=Coccidioides immitis (strain RS) TaxID=246410 RepID=J3KCM1_COCIM|nr:membrane insertase COX18 [Coccidioides immitis RS]EAS32999.3 hypothetical protein CIMG_04023 [Coccidioides immitis RS]